MILRTAFAAIALLCLASTGAGAASLRVAPVLLDVPTGATSTTLTVWNTGTTPVSVQVRVYRSSKQGNDDVLSPTKDVVASPPIATLKAGGENLIRIVRVATGKITARENYRVLVDQLPDPKAAKAGVVSILVRHAIPLHFEP